MSPPTFRRRILNAHRQLVKLYGEPKHRPRRDALSQLIATILSQNTSDVNTVRAFDNLRAQFSTWEAVRDAPTRAVVRAIRSAGLANTKAPRIQAILRQLTTQHHVEENKTELDSRMSRDSASGRERGSLSPDFLRALPVGEASVSAAAQGCGAKNCVHRFTVYVWNAGVSGGHPHFPCDQASRLDRAARLARAGARDFGITHPFGDLLSTASQPNQVRARDMPGEKAQMRGLSAD